MISLLTMSVNALANALVYILKAFFSLLLWFLKALLRGLKLCFVALPVTTAAFAALFCVEAFLLITKQNPFPTDILSPDAYAKASSMMSSLVQWWVMEIYSKKGSVSFIPLLFLTVMMFLPVMAVFISISVFISFGRILFLALAADLALYVILTVLGKPFIVQAMDRYFRLFPDAGRKHEERTYDRLLRRRNKELEDELRQNADRRRADFYSDPDDDRYEEDEYQSRRSRNNDSNFYEDDDYDPEFEEEYGDESDEFYEDEEEFYEDEEFEDEDDYELDDYDSGYDADVYEEDDDDELVADMFTGQHRARKKTYSDKRKHSEASGHNSYGDNRQNEYKSDNFGKKDSKNTTAPSGSARAFDFFAGCNSRESVDKKYKSLVKLYHPDNMDGDTAALQEINVQYDKAKKRFQ